MTGFRAFLAKELAETIHTWRIWVLPGFLLFSAVTSPLLTYFMPELMELLGGEQVGLAIEFPEPTAAMAYVEYLGNLAELVMLALVIAYGGIVSAEVRSGTGALTLAKPLSRNAFVLAKWLSQFIVLAVAGVLATAICIGLTALLLDAGPAAELVAAAGLWLVNAAFLLSVMVLLSVALRAPAAASGAGVGVYIGLVVLGQFGRISDVTPAGLGAAGSALVLDRPAVWATPLIASVAAIAVLLVAALWLFSRKEL